MLMCGHPSRVGCNQRYKLITLLSNQKEQKAIYRPHKSEWKIRTKIPERERENNDPCGWLTASPSYPSHPFTGRVKRLV